MPAPTIIRKASWLPVLVCALLPSIGYADSWIPAQEKTYTSDDSHWRLTVTPRPIGGALAYFQDKVDNLDNAGGVPGAADHAVGRMEQRIGRRWVETWRGPLVNDVAPVSALVSALGQTVTFDNWHSMGHGEDAVVIYDVQGKVVRAMGLDDFLPPAYVEALPRTVSSIHWGRGHVVSEDGSELVLRVVVPDEERSGLDARDLVDVRFDMATGEQRPLEGDAWTNALARAERVAAMQQEERRQWQARFVAPLSAPDAGADTKEWHVYLVEAFFRLDPHWDDGYPAAKVVHAKGSQGHARSVGWLRDALVDDCGQDCVVMVASPSQEALVEALVGIGPEIAPGGLQGGRVYVAVDDGHAEAAHAALAHASPTWIRIDPAHPIPQRAERLERLAEREAQASAEDQ
jgi:hypothetical protein